MESLEQQMRERETGGEREEARKEDRASLQESSILAVEILSSSDGGHFPALRLGCSRGLSTHQRPQDAGTRAYSGESWPMLRYCPGKYWETVTDQRRPEKRDKYMKCGTLHWITEQKETINRKTSEIQINLKIS